MSNQRAETNPMQFGDDWKGVFIRGDNAFYYAQSLKAVLSHISFTDDFAYKHAIQGLINLLENSNRHTGTNPQYMKPFEECINDRMENNTKI